MSAFNTKEVADALLLLRLAGEGHNAAFDALSLKFGNWLIAAAFRVLKKHEDAQDAAQEAWILLWNETRKRRGEWPDDTSVPVILTVMGRQAGIRTLERRYARKRGGRDPGFFTYDLLAELHGTYRWKRGGRAHDMTERVTAEDPMKKFGMVRRLAMQLPAQHLAALDSLYFKGESMAVLAERLRMSVEHANRIVCHGVQILRHLAEECTPAEFEQCQEAA
jgi:DNA-directed RNA polymerase specialized sigma24 family protein